MKKTALVTGASSGIGLDISKTLVKQGFTVYAGVRKTEDGDKLKALGCQPVIMDVTKQENIDSFFLNIDSLDVLVNNAGIAVVGPVEGLPIDKLHQQMEVNFFSVYRVTQKALPLLRKSQGRIINMGSISGQVTAPLFTPYSCSKYALRAFNEGLRRELKSFNVKVCLIEPGAVETPIWEKSKKTNEELLSLVPESIQQTYSKEIGFLRKTVDEAQKSAVPVKQVTEAVIHAVTSARPRTRYLIGRDAKVVSFLLRFLPDSIMDRLVKVV